MLKGLQVNMKSFLSHPAVYRFFGRVIGGSKARAVFVKEYIRPREQDKVLDIGCGPADILDYLPEVNYLGFDISEEYIHAARKHFKRRGRFLCAKVSKDVLSESSFDIVLAIGIVHHLNDQDALQLFDLAQTSLKPGGRLITLDGCYIEGQSRIERYIVARDRGQYVRTEEKYRELASQSFMDVHVDVRHDLLPIPYSHIIAECTK